MSINPNDPKQLKSVAVSKKGLKKTTVKDTSISELSNKLNNIDFDSFNQQFSVDRYDESVKALEIRKGISEIGEKEKDGEHRRNQEVKQQQDNLQFELVKLERSNRLEEARIELEQNKIELDKERLRQDIVKQEELERQNAHQRNLENIEQANVWKLTSLSFFVGVFLVLMGFTAGAVIASAALSLPASSYLIKKITGKDKDGK